MEGHREQCGPVGDDTVTFDVTVPTGAPGTDDMSGIVQKFVDLAEVPGLPGDHRDPNLLLRGTDHAHRVAAARPFTPHRPAGAFLMSGGRMAWYPGATRMARRPESDAQATIRRGDAVHRALAGRDTGGEAHLRALTRLHQPAVALRARLRGRPRPVHRPESRTDANWHAGGTSAVSIETDKQVEQALRCPLITRE